MDCICEKKISAVARTKWLEVIPKILEVARSENNATIQSLLGSVTEESSLSKSLLSHKQMNMYFYDRTLS